VESGCAGWEQGQGQGGEEGVDVFVLRGKGARRAGGGPAIAAAQQPTVKHGARSGSGQVQPQQRAGGSIVDDFWAVSASRMGAWGLGRAPGRSPRKRPARSRTCTCPISAQPSRRPPATGTAAAQSRGEARRETRGRASGPANAYSCSTKLVRFEWVCVLRNSGTMLWRVIMLRDGRPAAQVEAAGQIVCGANECR
jgi:hypothetical protein